MAMAALHRVVDDAVGSGVFGRLVDRHPALDGSDADDRWWRYEAVVDEVLGHRPLHAICTFDAVRDARPARLRPARATGPAPACR